MNNTFWKVFAVIALIVLSVSIVLHGAMPRYKVMGKSRVLDSWTGKTKTISMHVPHNQTDNPYLQEYYAVINANR